MGDGLAARQGRLADADFAAFYRRELPVQLRRATLLLGDLRVCVSNLTGMRSFC
jgi:hypothetical protein